MESPSQVGSITPSSRFLAKKTLEPIDWNTARAIAELGAGTGAFTKHIQTFKYRDCKVAVFEKDEEMRDELNEERRLPSHQSGRWLGSSGYSLIFENHMFTLLDVL